MTTIYPFGRWIELSSTSDTVFNPFARWYDADVAAGGATPKGVFGLPIHGPMTRVVYQSPDKGGEE